MAWNEPGNKGGERDPWRKPSGEGPPDLDKVFSEFLRKFKKVLGGGRVPTPSGPSFAWQPVAAVLGLLYGIMGIYIVEPAEEAVVTRFGRYVAVEGAGPHWYPRGIESVVILNVKEVSENQHSGLMLTKDENIVSVEIAVQYQRENAKDYCFNVYQPDETLKQVTDSALRYVIGHSTLDEVLTSGRAEIAQQIREQITNTLADYSIGISVSEVVMQPAKAPDEVKQAFDDAIRAQEDEIRLVNQADAYSRKNMPIADGRAERLVEEANAYRSQVLARARGDVDMYNAMLKQYQKAPEVTRKRMFIDTMQQVYSNTSKVMVEGSGSQPFIYMPLDKIIGANGNASSSSNTNLAADHKLDGAPSISSTNAGTGDGDMSPMILKQVPTPSSDNIREGRVFTGGSN